MLSKSQLKDIKHKAMEVEKEILDEEVCKFLSDRHPVKEKPKKIPLLLSHWDSIEMTCKLGKSILGG